MFIIASTLYMLAQCSPSICELSGVTYPNVQECRAGAVDQTRSYKAAGTNAWGKCVSREIPDPPAWHEE